MTQRTRILVAFIILVAVVGAVLGLDALQRTSSEPTLAPGSIPLYLDGRLLAGFTPDDLDQLKTVSFVEAEEGKKQEGWLLRDVILLYVDASRLEKDPVITVSSSSRNRSAALTWGEVDDHDNMVMFDLSSRGTLKLVSLLEKLDTRDEWVQDADKIEIASP